MKRQASSSGSPVRRSLRPRKEQKWDSDSSSTSSPVRRGTGRGRGRGRGRPSGRGTRGGHSGTRGLHRGDLAAQALQERQRNFQAFIEEMTDEERKELLLKAGEKHPSLFMQIIDGHHAPHGGFHPQPTDQTPSWCSCLRCRDMPTQAERICCGRPPNQCQSQLPDFNLLVMDELVLQIAQMYRQDVLALPQDEDYNKGKRHTVNSSCGIMDALV